jgi:hypothetical protein
MEMIGPHFAEIRVQPGRNIQGIAEIALGVLTPDFLGKCNPMKECGYYE